MRKNPIFSIVCLSAVLHVLAAYHSVGPYHPDEHFQVLEFASYKMGNIAASELPWEFEQRIRPWLMPTVFYGLASTATAVGIEDPFTHVLLFRLLTAVLGFSALLVLWSFCRQQLRLPAHPVLAGMIFLMFYMPFLNARASSESWSAIFLVFSLALLARRENSLGSFFLGGVFAAISFECRYLTAAMIGGAFLWILTYQRPPAKKIGVAAGGFIAGEMLAAGLNYWGYGAWAFPAWNYLDANLFAGVANSFGVEPFWYYAWETLARYSLVGVCLLASTLLYWILQRQSLITWITLPFVLLHCVVGHKEYRFLGPIFPFVPFMVFSGWQALRSFCDRTPNVRRIVMALLVCILVQNTWMLLKYTFRPARTQVAALEAIADLDSSPVAMFGGDPTFNVLPMRYYLPAGVAYHKKESKTLKREDVTNYPIIYLHSRGYPPEMIAHHCRLEWQYPGDPLQSYLPLLVKRVKFHRVYSCPK